VLSGANKQSRAEKIFPDDSSKIQWDITEKAVNGLNMKIQKNTNKRGYSG
jgi:hypothetical protein